jgi:hypothetical protein
MAHMLAKRRVIKNGGGNVDNIPAATPPPWVHCYDPRYMLESVSGPTTSGAPGATVTAPGHVPRHQGGSASPLQSSCGIPATRQLRPAAVEGGGPVAPPDGRSASAAGPLPGQSPLWFETIHVPEVEAPPKRAP